MPLQFKEPPEVVDVPPKVDHFTLPEGHCYGNHRYGVVTLTQGEGQSSIDWMSCVYIYGKGTNQALYLYECIKFI